MFLPKLVLYSIAFAAVTSTMAKTTGELVVTDDPEEACGRFSNCATGSYLHFIQGPAPSPARKYLHGECLVCVDTENEILPKEDCHPECTLASIGADSLTLRRYADARDAARSGDVQSLTVLAQQIPKYVKLNSERGAVQLYDCGATAVIASLSLDLP